MICGPLHWRRAGSLFAPGAGGGCSDQPLCCPRGSETPTQALAREAEMPESVFPRQDLPGHFCHPHKDDIAIIVNIGVLLPPTVSQTPTEFQAPSEALFGSLPCFTLPQLAGVSLFY